MVGKDHHRHVQILARDRPEPLHRIHGRAVTIEGQDLAIRTGNRRADGQGNALTDRAAR